MTLQETLDHTVRHYITEGNAPGYNANTDTCTYEDEWGHCCSIGNLLSPVLRRDLVNCGVNILLADSGSGGVRARAELGYSKEAVDVNRKYSFFLQLQVAHDTSAGLLYRPYRSKGQIDFREDPWPQVTDEDRQGFRDQFARRLHSLAEDYGLTYPEASS